MGFIFGGNTGETQESLKRKRDYAQALMAAKGAPRDVGEGLNSLGNAIAYRMALSQIGKGEAAMAEKNAALMAPIVESFGGGAQQFPEPPASPSAPKETAKYSPNEAVAATLKGEPVQGTLANGGAIDRASVAGYSGDVRQMYADALSGNVRGGKGWTEVVGPDGVVVRREGARNWRNNNPGNIEYGKFAQSAGAIGSDGRFAVFPSYEAGRAAKAKLLFESPSYNTKTIAGAISRYAPQFENDTGGYISAVAGSIGVSPNTPISSLNPQQRQTMLDAMQKVEGFKVGREVRNGKPSEGVQGASLDPSIGMASYAPAEQPQSMYVGEVGANGAISTKERPAANAIRKMLGGQEQPAPVQVAQAAPQGQVSEQQVVQELFGSPAPRPQLNPGMLMQALSDPNISEQNRATLQGLLQNEMKKADPAYQAQQQMDQIGLQKAQIELQKLQNPDPVAPKFENVGGRLVKINPDGSVSEAYAPPPDPADQIQQQAAQIGLQKSQLELQQMQNPQPKLENIGGRLVQVNPDGSAKEVYAPPAPVTTEITDVNGKRVLVNKQTGEVVRELGESPSKQKDAPAGYQMNADGKTMSRIPGYRDTNLEMDMRKEFDTQTKDFRAVRDSYNRIQASAENPTPAGDLSLIFNYMKMLDPGSVVREAEFATASNAAPLLTRYGLDAEKLKGVWEGQKLTPEQRADFLNRSNQLYAEQDQTFQSLADQYSQTASRNGLDPNNIILTPRSNPRKKKAEPVTINGYQIEQVED